METTVEKKKETKFYITWSIRLVLVLSILFMLLTNTNFDISVVSAIITGLCIGGSLSIWFYLEKLKLI